MSRTAVQFVHALVLGGVLLVTGCAGGAPDWAELTGDYWGDPNKVPIARYYSLKRVTDCKVREIKGTADVSCRLEVKLKKDFQEIQNELGSVIDSPLVAELTQRFGRFQRGEESTMAVTTRFRKESGDWVVDPEAP